MYDDERIGYLYDHVHPDEISVILIGKYSKRSVAAKQDMCDVGGFATHITH